MKRTQRTGTNTTKRNRAVSGLLAGGLLLTSLLSGCAKKEVVTEETSKNTTKVSETTKGKEETQESAKEQTENGLYFPLESAIINRGRVEYSGKQADDMLAVVKNYWQQEKEAYQSNERMLDQMKAVDGAVELSDGRAKFYETSIGSLALNNNFYYYLVYEGSYESKAEGLVFSYDLIKQYKNCTVTGLNVKEAEAQEITYASKSENAGEIDKLNSFNGMTLSYPQPFLFRADYLMFDPLIVPVATGKGGPFNLKNDKESTGNVIPRYLTRQGDFLCVTSSLKLKGDYKTGEDFSLSVVSDDYLSSYTEARRGIVEAAMERLGYTGTTEITFSKGKWTWNNTNNEVEPKSGTYLESKEVPGLIVLVGPNDTASTWIYIHEGSIYYPYLMRV